MFDHVLNTFFILKFCWNSYIHTWYWQSKHIFYIIIFFMLHNFKYEEKSQSTTQPFSSPPWSAQNRWRSIALRACTCSSGGTQHQPPSSKWSIDRYRVTKGLWTFSPSIVTLLYVAGHHGMVTRLLRIVSSGQTCLSDPLSRKATYER